ncbi:hypothetical protein [Kribbella solani]|uniref:hypothetical protein n=1 Tax=Kribbella solani TaxID=236067 RepID=UPI0029BD8944|nr:hypothetical protein [Kribbella solani]MDX2968603.1 hypothetical protein [Kribbella solani]
MNAAATATIASLISAGEVERVPVDHDVVANLLRQAGNHLRTAAAGADADADADELLNTVRPAIDRILNASS